MPSEFGFKNRFDEAVLAAINAPEYDNLPIEESIRIFRAFLMETAEFSQDEVDDYLSTACLKRTDLTKKEESTLINYRKRIRSALREVGIVIRKDN